jgi:hypothetical protein
LALVRTAQGGDQPARAPVPLPASEAS